MANINEERCEDLRAKLETKLDRSLGREIGQIRAMAEEAKTCAGKKLEKTTFRWAFGILVFVLGSVLVGLFGLSIFNGRANASTEKTVAGMVEKVAATKEKVDTIDRDFRDFRTEQRTQFQELKDLVQENH